MNTARAETPSLRVLVASRPGLRVLAPGAALRGRDIGASTIFASRRRELAGKSVLIGARSQFVAARALIELDGLAARLVICPPDFSPRRLAAVISQAEVDAIVSDEADKDFGADREIYLCADPVPIDEEDRFTRLASQWVLPTSGTTGAPKLVAHRLEGLLGAIRPASEPIPVWATFYDIRRYGGLQIFLRACVTGAQLLLSDAGESLGDYMTRCAKAEREPYFRHAVALAPVAHERPRQGHRPEICPAFRRDRRSRHSRRVARRLSQGRHIPRIRLDRGGRRLRGARWARGISGGVAGRQWRGRAAPARRFAACPLQTDRDRLHRSGRSETARRRGFCRHGRHGRAKGRPLLLQGSSRRRHQCRRVESASRGSRAGHQRAQRGPYVAASAPGAVRSWAT